MRQKIPKENVIAENTRYIYFKKKNGTYRGLKGPTSKHGLSQGALYSTRDRMVRPETIKRIREFEVFDYTQREVGLALRRAGVRVVDRRGFLL